MPRILMTDLAFAAFNAYCSMFPGLKWLYCVFHLDQALRKTFKQMADPGLPDGRFKLIKRFAMAEVHELVCGAKGRPLLDKVVFNERCARVTKALWAAGCSTEAARWETYVKNQEHWAPYARWEACSGIVDANATKLPFFAISNNSLESFFRVWKYDVQGGKAAFTMTELMSNWVNYQARILVNMLDNNIDVGAVLGVSPQTAQAEREMVELDGEHGELDAELDAQEQCELNGGSDSGDEEEDGDDGPSSDNEEDSVGPQLAERNKLERFSKRSSNMLAATVPLLPSLDLLLAGFTYVVDSPARSAIVHNSNPNPEQPSTRDCKNCCRVLGKCTSWRSSPPRPTWP